MTEPPTTPMDQPSGSPTPYQQQPTPYQQQPPYTNPYPPYQAPPPYNTYAILALILAIFVFPPLGIYFGRKAKEQIAQTGERGIELANAAVIVGWVLTAIFGAFLVVWCLFAVVWLGFFGLFGFAAANG